MRRPYILAVLLAASLAPSISTAQSTPPATPNPLPITFHGRAELSPGVPCASCAVVLEGAPLGATTDATGLWSISHVPSGLWQVRLTHPNFGYSRVNCGGASSLEIGDVVQCALPPIARPGGINGRISFASSSDYDTAVIGVPELGVYTQINCGGGYLLTGVAPGWRKLVVTTNTTSKELWVYVTPGQVTMKMNLTFITAVPPPPN